MFRVWFYMMNPSEGMRSDYYTLDGGTSYRLIDRVYEMSKVLTFAYRLYSALSGKSRKFARLICHILHSET